MSLEAGCEDYFFEQDRHTGELKVYDMRMNGAAQEEQELLSMRWQRF